MRPIPVAFHIWFIEVHTYGIGLAITFWFGLRYTERRIRNAGYPWVWITSMFLWVILAAIVGARTLNVLSNLGSFSGNPLQVFAIWQGGLSSFGGLLFAVPTGIFIARKRCPEVSISRLLDLIAPVLAACWSLGRLLGPQLMVAGGGHPTNQWFGMYYANQAGKRLPVPLFQSMEDAAIFGVLLLVERWLRSVAPLPIVAYPEHPASPRVLPPNGIIIGVGMFLWGIERFLDEHLWLSGSESGDSHLGSLLVQIAGIALAVSGAILLATRLGPLKRWRSGEWVTDEDRTHAEAAASQGTASDTTSEADADASETAEDADDDEEDQLDSSQSDDDEVDEEADDESSVTVPSSADDPDT